MGDVTRAGGNGGCRITVAPGHLAKEIMLKKSTRHIRLFLWLSFRCRVSLAPGPTSCQSLSLRVDRLQTTGLTNGPVTSDVATRRSSFGSILQPSFFRSAKSLRLEASESLPEGPTSVNQPVCLCLSALDRQHSSAGRVWNAKCSTWG